MSERYYAIRTINENDVLTTYLPKIPGCIIVYKIYHNNRSFIKSAESSQQSFSN